jgi:hypothetical protein
MVCFRYVSVNTLHQGDDDDDDNDNNNNNIIIIINTVCGELGLTVCS